MITGVILLLLAAFAAVYMNLPKFGRAPRGERKARIERSPNFRDGQFQNQLPTPQLTSDKGMFSLFWGFLFESRPHTRPDRPIESVKTDLKALIREQNLLVWFGHSSYYLQSAGVRIAVDPVFEAAAPVPLFNKPFEGTDIFRAEELPELDFLVITHDHWDHLDYETVRRLDARHVVCPLGVGEYFEQWGFTNVVELDWNESAEVDSVKITCLPARHFSGRTMARNRTLWASFMVQTAEQTIYLGGDSGYGPHFKAIGEQFPAIDVAVVENGQYDLDWRYIHTLPDELPRVVADLGARRVFPFHNSKYALSRHPWDEPRRTAEKLGLELPAIGQVVLLE